MKKLMLILALAPFIATAQTVGGAGKQVNKKVAAVPAKTKAKQVAPAANKNVTPPVTTDHGSHAARPGAVSAIGSAAPASTVTNRPVAGQ